MEGKGRISKHQRRNSFPIALQQLFPYFFLCSSPRITPEKVPSNVQPFIRLPRTMIHLAKNWKYLDYRQKDVSLYFKYRRRVSFRKQITKQKYIYTLWKRNQRRVSLSVYLLLSFFYGGQCVGGAKSSQEGKSCFGAPLRAFPEMPL